MDRFLEVLKIQQKNSNNSLKKSSMILKSSRKKLDIRPKREFLKFATSSLVCLMIWMLEVLESYSIKLPLFITQIKVVVLLNSLNLKKSTISINICVLSIIKMNQLLQLSQLWFLLFKPCQLFQSLKPPNQHLSMKLLVI